MTEKEFEHQVMIFRVLLLGTSMAPGIYGDREEIDILLEDMLKKIDHEILIKSKDFMDKFNLRYAQLSELNAEIKLSYDNSIIKSHS